MKKEHDLVREAYGAVARQQSSCCGPKSSCCSSASNETQDNPVPEAELGLSCGDPVAFSHIKEGDVVVDLGSGAGKDVFLAAPKAGPGGRVIGVDMTPEMLALAKQNAEKHAQRTGLRNVEFREGQIENLPIEDGTVDLVISNCVINLSPDKPRVFREVHRVLKSGGKMVVSDIVLNRELSKEARESKSLYAACIAGALLREDYLSAIRKAGFRTIQVLNDQTYETGQSCCDPVTSSVESSLVGAAASITVMAAK
jgi:arsenite methyltransferase